MNHHYSTVTDSRPMDDYFRILTLACGHVRVISSDGKVPDEARCPDCEREQERRTKEITWH